MISLTLSLISGFGMEVLKMGKLLYYFSKEVVGVMMMMMMMSESGSKMKADNWGVNCGGKWSPSFIVGFTPGRIS